MNNMLFQGLTRSKKIFERSLHVSKTLLKSLMNDLGYGVFEDFD